MPEITLPVQTAERMGCRVGEKVRIYFFGDKMRVRVYTLVGVYESTGMELSPALCPLSSLQRLNRWDDNTYSRLMLMLREPSHAERDLSELIASLQKRPNLIGQQDYGLNLGEELQPELFNWLTFLDTNVYALLSLMILVGGFTMITGLIILVLDKSKQIGILKALALGLVQQHFRLIRLNPANYFMSSVPIHFDPWAWVGINAGTLLLILIMILVPTGIVSRIRPAESMRID